PTQAKSLAYNLTVAGTENRFRGHMLVFPADLRRPPLASSINFPPHFDIANASIIRMNNCSDYSPSTPHPCVDGDIAILLFLANSPEGPSLGSGVHVALDVVGYFR